MYNKNLDRSCSCMANICADDIQESMLEDQYLCDSYESNYNDCDCGFNDYDTEFPNCPMFGQSYVPIQYMDKTFKPKIGLEMGTIFPELVSPYSPCQSMEEIAYIREKNVIGKGCNKWK